MRLRSLAVTATFSLALFNGCGGDDTTLASMPGGEGGASAHAGTTTSDAGSGGSGGGATSGGSGAGGSTPAGSGGETSVGGVEMASSQGGGAGSEAGGGSLGGAGAGPNAGGESGSVAGAGGDSSAGVAGAGGRATQCAVTTDKQIFVSSTLYTGALGGLPGADDKCQKLAEAAGLCGTFKAWLGNDDSAPVDRFTHPDGNYVLVSGEIVASGWNGLTSGSLQHAINVTEKSTPAPLGTVRCGANPDSPVWTDVLKGGGIAKSGSCADWSSSGTSVSGVFGDANSKTASWTQMCQLLTVCQDTAALYCVEQ